MTTWKNAFTSCLIVFICAVASFSQAPPEIKSKLDAKIKQLSSFSTDPEIVKRSEGAQHHTSRWRGTDHDQ
jgi:outer membrane lipoprotein-sorting protein